MWSDPTEDREGWSMNPRMAGYLFGKDIAQKFNHENGLTMICRAHQLVEAGYREIWNGALVTVWSAPNYCYRCGNDASILEYDEHLNKYYKIFRQSVQAEHPPNSRAAQKDNLPAYFL